MSRRLLTPAPLTPEDFAPFGDVISTAGGNQAAMNDARFERFDALATVDIDQDGDVAISLAKARTPTSLPYAFNMVERHPLGSQAFIPLGGFRFVVVVAAPGESVSAADLCAFVSNGSQGINYHRGTWHMPLIALESGQTFLIVDRVPGNGNVEEHVLESAVELNAF